MHRLVMDPQSGAVMRTFTRNTDAPQPTLAAFGNDRINVSSRKGRFAAFHTGGERIHQEERHWPCRFASRLLSGHASSLPSHCGGNGVSDLIVQFPSYGGWILYNNTSWVQLHPTDAAGFVTGNIDGDAEHRSDVIIDFPGAGIWALQNGTAWSQLHGSTPELMLTGK
jgi:hypothetical protein